jgi:hypothetical protein
MGRRGGRSKIGLINLVFGSSNPTQNKIDMTEVARQAFLAYDWSKDTRWQSKLGTIELKEGGLEEFNRAVVRRKYLCNVSVFGSATRRQSEREREESERDVGFPLLTCAV